MSKSVEYILFTDASKRTGYSGKDYCGYGVVLLNTKTKNYTTFSGELSPRSVVFCEAWAIFRGLVQLVQIMKPKKKKVNVLVISDSLLNVDTFNTYIPHSWNLSDWKNWKKKDGSLVKNQDIYRRILTFMGEHDEIDVKFAHINSHLSEFGWTRIQDKLYKYGVRVEEDTAQMIRSMNAKADDLAQTVTHRMQYLDEYDDDVRGFYRMIRKGDLNE